MGASFAGRRATFALAVFRGQAGDKPAINREKPTFFRRNGFVWGGFLVGLAFGVAGLQDSRSQEGWSVRASPWLVTTPTVLDPGSGA